MLIRCFVNASFTESSLMVKCAMRSSLYQVFFPPLISQIRVGKIVGKLSRSSTLFSTSLPDPTAHLTYLRNLAHRPQRSPCFCTNANGYCHPKYCFLVPLLALVIKIPHRVRYSKSKVDPLLAALSPFLHRNRTISHCQCGYSRVSRKGEFSIHLTLVYRHRMNRRIETGGSTCW